MKKVKKVIGIFLIVALFPGMIAFIPFYNNLAHIPQDPSIQTPIEGLFAGIFLDVVCVVMLLFIALVIYLISGENILKGIMPKRNPKP